jgi:hypothetical protein
LPVFAAPPCAIEVEGGSLLHPPIMKHASQSQLLDVGRRPMGSLLARPWLVSGRHHIEQQIQLTGLCAVRVASRRGGLFGVTSSQSSIA